ncbi:hypothetical protein [uncultured Ruminococcus sp.]|uniref:hypothetical protein n=1 Tax=uncultured Ruminococcus sp. TaxID=165186 RepID=UPI0025E1AA61|nr:hypothetical protein [uncultured Ruminococcus sp.]
MKKLLSAVLSAFIACSTVITGAFTAYAEEEAQTEDIKIDCSSAQPSENWGQSITIEQSTFDATKMTEDSKIIVTYTSEDINEKAGNKYNAELVFQSWDNTTSPKAQEGAVWAKVAPVEFDDTSATYDYNSIAEAYGTNDFSQVYNVIVGSTDRAKITCTGITVTNCKTKTYIETEKKAESKTNPLIIIGAAVAGIAVAVIVIVVIMNKKSSKAFDVSTGTFVDKKNVKDAKK